MSRRKVGEVRSFRTTAGGDFRWIRYDAHSPCSASVAQSGPLRRAVRRALFVRRPRLAARALAGGLASVAMAIGAAPNGAAAPFPAVFPLASLLPGGGGDGSAGFVLNGIDADDQSGLR